ncbi:MAG: hypothetical protein JO001_20960 [Alphaproteobacteria bacterium]|nr:hypothetical protein [Alphaproteobacteria bacterium]
MAARKPLSFDLDKADPVPQPANAPASVTSPPAKAKPVEEARQQVGARISAKTYRQLKSRAALEGRKVQDLVELAVERYLAEPTSQEAAPE